LREKNEPAIRRMTLAHTGRLRWTARAGLRQKYPNPEETMPTSRARTTTHGPNQAPAALTASALLLAAAVLLTAAPAHAETTPQRGQSPNQQAQDTTACADQARQRTNHDPAQPPPSLTTDAAKAAAAGAVTGLLSGDPAKGAATGAATAALRHRTQSAATQEKQAAYDRERAACLTARGYAVK